MTELDEQEVERRVRASLDAHAAEVDTTVPLSVGAGSRRRRWLAAGAVAAVAAAIVAVTVPVVILGGDEPKRSLPTPATELPTPTTDLPGRWRTELWHGVSVDVPATWSWGAGLIGRGDEEYRCGGPDDATPYVGRPIYLSDLCIGGPEKEPKAPYVWFDAPVEPGSVELADGYVQQTVEVGGSTVTVGSDDAALRGRILSSVTVQDACPPTPADEPGLGGIPTEGVGQVQGFQLCAYDRSELVYGADLGADGYARWHEALPDDVGTDVVTGCPVHDEKVLLIGTFDDPFGPDPISLTWLVDVRCNVVDSVYGDVVSTRAMKEVWADQGVRSVLPSFIGMLG
jgi:hypothetical protein